MGDSPASETDRILLTMGWLEVQAGMQHCQKVNATMLHVFPRAQAAHLQELCKPSVT